MFNRYIKSSIFIKGVSCFLVFLLSLNAVFLGFTKKAEALVGIDDAAIVLCGSMLIAGGLSFVDTTSLQGAVQQFQDANTEGWALMTAAAGAAYAYGSCQVADVNDDLWTSIVNFVDTNFNVGENPTYTQSPLGEIIPNYFFPPQENLVVSNGTGSWTITRNLNAGNWYWDAWSSSGSHLSVPESYGPQYKTYVNDGYLWLAQYRSNGTFLSSSLVPGAVLAAPILGDIVAEAEAIIGGAEVGTANRDIPKGPNGNRPVGFPWPVVGATGVSLTLDQILDYLLGKGSTDVINGGQGLGETPQTPTDPLNPPVGYPDTDVGWLQNIWGQLVAVKTGVLTLSKTVSDFIAPPVAVSVNLEPLKLTGVALTNVFPFSLPWDLARSMNPFYTTSSFEPILSLGPFDMPGVGACTWAINLSNWSPAITLVRAMELLFFDIGLVLLTRKLMGGAV